MSKPEYIVRIPARFFKDPSISSDAKALRGLIGAFADGNSGETFVQPKKLDAVLGWGRRRRERAQTELVKRGWLKLKMRRGSHGVWARRIYVASVARFERSGETAQLISDHSQSQVMSSITTSLTLDRIPETSRM